MMVSFMKIRRMVAFLLSVVLSFAFTTTVFAAEPEVTSDNREYLIVNGTDIVYVGDEYENPATGEYIHWNSYGRGTDKYFEFKIQYSISSSKFTVHSSKVRVSANAQVVDTYNRPVSGYNGHLYTVSLVGLYNRNLQFSVGKTQSGTITGLNNGGSYKVQITNNDYVPNSRYLLGSGTVETA